MQRPLCMCKNARQTCPLTAYSCFCMRKTNSTVQCKCWNIYKTTESITLDEHYVNYFAVRQKVKWFQVNLTFWNCTLWTLDVVKHKCVHCESSDAENPSWKLFISYCKSKVANNCTSYMEIDCRDCRTKPHVGSTSTRPCVQVPVQRCWVPVQVPDFQILRVTSTSTIS